MDYKSIFEKRKELNYKRLIITHMGQDILQRIEEVECEYAEDGKVFYIM